jgi:hypothetical protein
MEGTMSDIMNMAKGIASEAFDKASDAAEIGKYKAKIVGKKNEIEKIERRMGLYIYLMYSEGEEDDGENLDPKLRDMCKQIDAVYDEIALLENKIDQVKE